MWRLWDEILSKLKEVPEYFRKRGMLWVVSRATFIVAALCTVALGVNKIHLSNRFTDWVGSDLGSLKMTVFLWLLYCISSLYKQQSALINDAHLANQSANNSLATAIEAMLLDARDIKSLTDTVLRNIETTMDLHVRAGTVFDHSSAVGDEAGLINRLNLKAHHSSHYISVHSEVLYYSFLCSVLASKKNEIQEVSRVHAFVPYTPTAMFLPDILDLLSEIKGKCNCCVYLFSNDVLDYDRNAMSDEKVIEGIEEHSRPRQQHLWSAFAKASHLLFRDAGAHYGFLRPTGAKSIWEGDGDFYGLFYQTFERLHLKCKDGSLAFIVTRDPDTFEFREAEIVSSRHNKELTDQTEAYFNKLLTKVGDGLYSAGDWERYKVEVALVSGEVMETYADRGVTLWAVDDFPVEEQTTGPQAIALQRWDIPGSTRDIAWTKSVVAALKGARVRRVFVVDEELFKNPVDTKSLFTIMATQHLFLTPSEGFSPLSGHDDHGAVRLVYRSNTFLSEAEAKVEGYPDLALMTRSNGGVETVLCGVIVQPKATYITGSQSNSQNWREWVSELWERSDAFPGCFASVKDALKPEISDIAQLIVDREELNLARHQSFERLKSDLQDWLTQTIDRL